jgi:hypothetical protein
LVNNRLEVKFWSEERKKTLDKNIEAIISRKSSPYDFVDELFKE